MMHISVQDWEMPETVFSEPNKKMTMTLRRLACVFIMLALVLPVSGCMKDESLESYRELMDQFFVDAAAFDDSINSIDPEAEDASQQFLKEIDGLNTLVSAMAEYEVPSQFSACESLADEAAENMNTAAQYWHQAYGDDGSFNEQMSDTAEQYYERANRRINAILEILHGNVPEDATVIEQEALFGTVAEPEEETRAETDEGIQEEVPPGDGSDAQTDLPESAEAPVG